MLFDIGPGGVGTLVCEVPPLQGFFFIDVWWMLLSYIG